MHKRGIWKELNYPCDKAGLRMAWRRASFLLSDSALVSVHAALGGGSADSGSLHAGQRWQSRACRVSTRIPHRNSADLDWKSHPTNYDTNGAKLSLNSFASFRSAYSYYARRILKARHKKVRTAPPSFRHLPAI